MLLKEHQENIVGVFRETDENGIYSYSFRNITEEEYHVVEKGEPASSDCYPEAAFWVSTAPFAGAEKKKWQQHIHGQIIYADRVAINVAMATEVTHDVVSDMIVEDAIVKDVDVVRIKIEKQSPVATSLQECNHQIVGMDDNYIYFETDIHREADLRESTVLWNPQEDRFEVDRSEEAALRGQEDNQIERIEINISAFIPLFYKTNNTGRKERSNIANAARFMLQQKLGTGEENIVCPNVTTVRVGGNRVKVDFAYEYCNVDYEGKIQKYDGISSKRLSDFRIYKEFAEKAGIMGLKNLKFSDIENMILDEIEERRKNNIAIWNGAYNNVDFSDVMKIMEKTCINENRYDEKSVCRIIYRDNHTGWRCIFSVKERYDTGKPKILRLIDFYNSFIDEELKNFGLGEIYKAKKAQLF